jgi:hopanoid biosynthesis associated protein HpnK
MSATYLILNADDFGLSPAVNAAILRAHRQGVLTSASLMVAEPAWQEAAEMARQNPALGVGLHLVVISDRALLPRSETGRGQAIRTLASSAFGSERFDANPLRAGLCYVFSKTAQRALLREMEAQFARFAQTGLEWSHVDGHQHYHLHPFVWDALLALCDRYGVHRLRVPHEPIRAHLRDPAGKPDFNTFAALALRAMRRRNLRILRQRRTLGGKTPFLCDRVYGLLQTGNMETEYVVRLLRRLEGVTNEVYFHPGAPHARQLPCAQQTDTVRDVELQALLHPAIRETIRDGGLHLGRYADVEAALGANSPVKK